MSYLFNSLGLSVKPVACYLVALYDPLQLAYGLVLDSRLKELFHHGLFLKSHPPRVDQPQQSVHQVLVYIVALDDSAQTSSINQLCKVPSISALVSGISASQARAPTRFPPWTVYEQALDSVSLAPSPTHLAKN